MGKQAQLKELLNALAAHIRARRKTLGVTQEQLADRAGLSPNYVARLEIAVGAPSLSTLISLSNALGTSVSELLALEPSDKWQDPAYEIGVALSRMKEPQAKHVLNQLRATVGLIESMED